MPVSIEVSNRSAKVSKVRFPPFATDAADFIKGKVGRKPINRRFLIVSPFLLARLPLDH